MKKVLVTGGAGYTGIPLCEALLERGFLVTLVDNFLYGYEPVLHLVGRKNLEIVKCDIRAEKRDYLKNKDVVFHLAGISGYPACEANPHSAKLINIEATRQIAKELSKQQLLVFASTTSLYGSSGSRSTERTPVHPVSLYGITKQEGETIVMDRENSVSLRWATVFGASSRMRSGLLVNDFVEKAVQERTIVLYDADSRRTFMHVLDLVSGYLFCLNHIAEMKGEVFNMGSERLNFTKREIAIEIQKRVPCEIMEAKVGDKDIRNFMVSFEKIKTLGYDCRYDLNYGLEELVKLYQFYTPNSPFKAI
jgi:nucleoside-diphosphate-sugar epimerase